MERVLTIGCPQLGLQWTQGGARGEVGSQVEFPMLGTVLWEGQAGGQVLHPVREGSCPASSTQATRDAIKAPHYWGNFQRQVQTAKGDEKGKEERRDGKGVTWAVTGREGQPAVPYTPADILVPQRSVQQEDRALG